MMDPWLPAAALADDAWHRLRREAIFACQKWDAQVEDVSTIARTPLIMKRDAWDELATIAERLAAETVAAEAELAQRPDLIARLGLPRAMRSALGRARPPLPGDVRVMRFDFHPTASGWSLSEVNSDVPGGFNEAGGVADLYRPHYPGTVLAGDPGAALAAAIAARGHRRVALVHATSFTDDRQVMVYLGQRLAEAGVSSWLTAPDGLAWNDGRVAGADLLVRFFPAEWLAELPRASLWRDLFSAAMPACNHPRALLSQSKRFPLAWDALRTPLPAWRALLPETRDPRDVPWRDDAGWLVKPALGRVGGGIGMHGVTSERDWRSISRSARWFPGSWVAQRRFASVAGPDQRHICVGVYTVDGRAAGAYGRCRPTPLIDHLAVDTPVLVAQSRSEAA